MMFNLKKRKSGFSLIELLVAITIMLLLVGLAAWFLDDYLYKAKVAKAQQDLDMFAGAIRLYDSLENAPFSNYNYNTATLGNIAPTAGQLSFYPVAINSWSTPMGTVGGASAQWTDYSQNSLVGLIGAYLKTVPPDPWGTAYVVNTSSGALSSKGSDLKTCIGGNSAGITETGRSRDIVNYYLGDKLVLSSVYVWDNNANGTIDAGEYIDFTFNKDVQALASATMSTDNCFEYSTDTLTWVALTSGNTTYGITSAAGGGAAISPVRLLNNARVLRYVFYVGVPMGKLVGAFARVAMNAAYGNGTYNPFIVDTDQYYKQVPASGVNFTAAHFGQHFKKTNNAPIEIKVRTY